MRLFFVIHYSLFLLTIVYKRNDTRKRNESGYVWTRKLLNPQQNVCGYKRIRIHVDIALLSALNGLKLDSEFYSEFSRRANWRQAYKHNMFILLWQIHCFYCC